MNRRINKSKAEKEMKTMTGLWKDLSDKEEAEFREWARKNYKPLSHIQGVWHWIIQEECVKINKESQGING